MAGPCISPSKLCATHIQAYRSRLLHSIATGSTTAYTSRSPFSTIPSLRDSQKEKNDADQKHEAPEATPEEEGAMTRRLAAMTEQAQEEGGSSAQKNLQGVEFSEELKKKLEERITASSFKSEHATAFALKDMPVRVYIIYTIIS